MVARRKLRTGGIACLAAVALFGACSAPTRTGRGKVGPGSSPAEVATAEVAGAEAVDVVDVAADAGVAKDAAPVPAEAATRREEPGETVPLFETDKENLGWRFDHGGEFPGAKGSLAVDRDAEREGRPTLRLSGDFSGGGNYVQMLRDLAGTDVGSLSLWLKTDAEIDSIVTRLVDQSICHQIRFRVKPTTEWQRVTFPLRRFFANERRDDSVVRYECWGGENDGVWHGPCKRVCVLATPPRKGKKVTLWINDISIVGPPTPVTTTVMPARLSANSVAPGSFVKITYNWRPEEPLLRGNSAFVHFVDKLGRTVHQDDHTPSVVTGSPGWRGEVSYERRVIIPVKLADGSYDILVGLYHRRPEPPGWKREPLEAGPGVEDAGERRFKVGTLVVDRNAPRPKADTEKAPTLSLDGFEITFSEEFDGRLDVSPWGPGTRWIAHTPWSRDFGDAAFANPRDGFPFTIEKGILRIEARKDENLKDRWKRKWEAGLLASNAPDGSGFSQRYGYFVMRAKLPAGPGVWPA
ncbi:MAG: LamG domain-containing protein, partial [Planctomycetota bacterium]